VEVHLGHELRGGPRAAQTKLVQVVVQAVAGQFDVAECLVGTRLDRGLG
jgi:hypothetical protein